MLSRGIQDFQYYKPDCQDFRDGLRFHNISINVLVIREIKFPDLTVVQFYILLCKSMSVIISL